MANLLYVTCDLKPVNESRCLKIGSEFLYEYINCNPSDEVYMLDLYRDNIQHSDADVMRGMEKMHNGHHLAALAPDEQRKIGRIMKLIDQFIAADKYVFVTTTWNLGFPLELRMYMDTICVASNIYRYTDIILKNQGRKCLLIYFVDGFDSEEKETLSVAYIKSAMRLTGIEKFEVMTVGKSNSTSEETRDNINNEIKKALEVAVRF
ncbi:MAG: NAD(P)H-dependent oxidoreductase [Oryzomonas sp.]|uniref:NAD(P)H-dependent oxidoreductase n=1 Tax=Oryzomonas sp. TaxID=2855186 RepID=UPI00283BBDC2|nr:NAD(P)H-dependent oxidoreductase [Oryzomonas sp.]MDR3581470.1 NAD(P)H-dependent oxidoreductase [Oryzomonas sp.]